jgi:peptidyl-prolyl cis-trans isomerase A (cyclophilin A)/peptidyl-prolyl cis-trans isomerase B (cyclophilin B)
MKQTLAAVAALLFTFSALAANPQVEVKTNLGSFVVELYPQKTPKTVANFLEYAQSGFYDGTIFHRVIDGFMAQGGGYTADFKQKKTRDAVENEAAAGLKNETGTIAMARTRDPHSATAQFFINVADNEFLNHRAPTVQGYGYCAFGRVVQGMEVVKQIAKSKTGPGGPFPSDVPQETVRIEGVKVTGGPK